MLPANGILVANEDDTGNFLGVEFRFETTICKIIIYTYKFNYLKKYILK